MSVEIPLYNEDGSDVKCWWCNSRWVDTLENGVWVHRDCMPDQMEAVEDGVIEKIWDFYGGTYCGSIDDEVARADIDVDDIRTYYLPEIDEDEGGLNLMRIANVIEERAVDRVIDMIFD